MCRPALRYPGLRPSYSYTAARIQSGALKADLGTEKLAAVTNLTAAWTLILNINTEELSHD